MRTDTFDRPGRADVIDVEPDDRQTIEELLRGSELPELPALRPDAYAAYLPVAATLKRQRADAKAMQDRARRVGALCGGDGFYRFPAGGSTVEGPTVRLAKALAIEWGAVAFGVEIDRIEGDRVYLTGVCVDLVNMVVVRRGSTFTLAPPPGKFALKADQRARWEAMQVQSAGAKALRGAILDALPTWFVDPAYQAALAADRKRVLREGQTIEDARDEAVRHFGGLKVTRDQLEAFLDTPMVQWAPDDIATLREVSRAIKSGEVTVEEVFAAAAPAADKPASTTTRASNLPGRSGAKKPTAPPPKGEPPPKDEPPPAQSVLINPPADDAAGDDSPL
jgi:hypothetical protein